MPSSIGFISFPKRLILLLKLPSLALFVVKEHGMSLTSIFYQVKLMEEREKKEEKSKKIWY